MGGSDASCHCGSCTPHENVFTCNDASHSECQQVVCGGTTYYCTNYGGSPGTWGSWGWRTSDLCQDGICDYCSGGSCQHQTSNEGRNCNDDCTHCVIGGHSTCDDRLQCDDTECSGQAACDADGGNCVEPDVNSPSGEMVCEYDVLGCHDSNHSLNQVWTFNPGTQPNCCEDDANEFLITNPAPYENRSGEFVTTTRCCNQSGDCPYEENGVPTCYHDGDRYDVNGDGNTEYCRQNSWLDCWFANPNPIERDSDCDDCYNCTPLDTCAAQPSQWDGNKCWDDCTFCNATPECQDRPVCNYTECRDPGWIYYVSPQAACNDTGVPGDCTDPDWNSAEGRVVCEYDLPGCWDSNHSEAYAVRLWSFEDLAAPPPQQFAECCGDDPFEYYREAEYAVGMWNTPYDDMCCDNATDCVIDADAVPDLVALGYSGVKCFASGITSIACIVDIDGDPFGHKDFCNKGMWMPCASNYTLTITGPYGIADEVYDATLPPEAFIPPASP